MPAPKYVPHYTVADYSQWEGEWELWGGIAVSMSPSPFGSHQKLVTKLSHRFVSALEHRGCNDCQAVAELDWIVSEETIVRPDLSIVCGSDLLRFIDKPPVLIVEVFSDSTKHKDQTSKYALYELQGVRYYILADPVSSIYEAFELNDGAYQSMPIGSAMKFELQSDCYIEVQLPSNVVKRSPP